MTIHCEGGLVQQRLTNTQPAWLPLLYWLGGTLAGLVFFVKGWQLLLPWGWMQANPYPGHLIIELISITILAIGGGMLGGWCARCARRLETRWSVVNAALLLAWVLAGFAGWLSQNVFQAGCAAGLCVCLWMMLRDRSRPGDGALLFLKTPHGWNLFFFVLFVLLSTAADAVLLPNAPPSRIAAADFVLGRFITHVHQAALIWFLLAWHDRWVPPAARWVGRTALALTPLFLMIDIILKMMWSKGINMLFAELEVGGKFDWRRALEGGGVTVTPASIVLSVLSVVVVIAVYLLCVWGSRRIGWRISPLGIVLLAFFSWTALQAEQGLGLVMKSRAWRWWEAKAAPMRFTSFAPDPGLASFKVVFRDVAPVVPAPVSNPKTQPDIYLFIVETFRSDALTSSSAPFLSHWRDTECQPLGETFSASNATHLSWFSLLSGRLPVFWDQGRQTAQLSPMLAALRQAGYILEARAVSDLNYMDILRTNFGAESQLDFLEFVDRSHPDHVLNPPDRETKMMAQLQDAVRQSPAGGTFRLTAFDATHYPYSWPDSYTPPLPDYDLDPLFPVHPTPDQIIQIRNRYQNSVSWIDHQMAAFVENLKELGRYDDALIIVTGDHGEEFQEHGYWFHCTALSPEQTHVPLLIKWPKSMGRGPTFTQASHLDVVPTLLELAGCPEETWSDLPGRSLLHAGEHTIITATHFASQDGAGFLLRRGTSVAAFGWPQIWVAAVPHVLWLERSSGLDSASPSTSPREYESLLKKTFPDAFERVFSAFEPK